MNVEKWVEGRQNLWRVLRFFFVLRRDISTRANLEWNKINFHVANICDHVGVFFRRFAAWIFGSRGTVSSNINICLSEIITMSGRYDVTMIWGGIVPPPGRLNGVMSAYNVHFDRSIF